MVAVVDSETRRRTASARRSRGWGSTTPGGSCPVGSACRRGGPRAPLGPLVGARVGPPRHPALGLARARALAAASLLVLTFVLPSRFRPLTGYLGVERLLRGHRALAIAAVALVLVHVAAVLLRPEPRARRCSTCGTAPPRVWAASIATIALLGLVALGLSRRRRRPRYEGWRLGHVVLANVALLATALHVLWLGDLTRYPEARVVVRRRRRWPCCRRRPPLALAATALAPQPLRGRRGAARVADRGHPGAARRGSPAGCRSVRASSPG